MTRTTYKTAPIHVLGTFGTPDDVYMLIHQTGQNYGGPDASCVLISATRDKPVSATRDKTGGDLSKSVECGEVVRVGFSHIWIVAQCYYPEDRADLVPLDVSKIPFDMSVALGIAIDRYTQ